MLTRWDPFSELSRLQNDVNRLRGESRLGFSPSVDIYEDDDAIVLSAEVPGLKPDDIHVHVENHVLTLGGERKLEREETKDRYHRVERSYGSFTRSFALPRNLDTESIEASLDDGVLRLRLPKKPQGETKRRIQIGS